MPELVACPSCGCKVQATDLFIGRPVRCIACETVFVAGQLPPPGPKIYPLAPTPDEDATPPRPDDWGRGPARQIKPLCPRCHRPVGWEELACPHCCHLFDTEEGPNPFNQPRRDADRHRGRLIDGLGTLCLVCGLLGLCTGGLGVVVSLATGLPALAMSGHDLERLRRNELDEAGRQATEMGRNKAIVGVTLAVIFSFILVLLCVEKFRN